MTKYVLFDLDGTLNDPFEGITSCIKYALSTVGLDETNTEKLRSFIGPPLRDTFAKYGFDNEKCEELVEKYREKFLVTGIHQNVPYCGVYDMLKSLHEHGCKIALASCKPEHACKIILEETGMLKYFDVVTGATLDKTLDTKPAIIGLSLERLGVKKEELEHVYMVGDRDMDMIGAHENGITAVGALYGYGRRKELLDAGADYLIRKPMELVDIVIEKRRNTMDKNIAFVERKRAERTMENLRKNRMEAYFAETSEDAVELVKNLIPEGSVCRVGGSRTLHETGIINLLENGNYDYCDSHVVPPEETEKARREAFFADYFLASANAITEDGEIYNVDGAGTRVAPIIFGPQNVILVCGTNKIVSDIAAAEDRLRNIAAPANAKRLGCKTPCTETGTCMNCKSPGRICCSYTLLGYQRIPNRIKVIFIGEHLGY